MNNNSLNLPNDPMEEKLQSSFKKRKPSLNADKNHFPR